MKYISKELQDKIMKDFKENVGFSFNVPIGYSGVSANSSENSVNGNTLTVTLGDGWGMVCGCTDNSEDFIPTKVLFNPPATVCFFPDGTKVVVKCADDEEFVEEEGVMACIVKKIFKSRNAFKKLVRDAYRQPKPEPKTKSVVENVILEPVSTSQDSNSRWEDDGGITLQVKE